MVGSIAEAIFIKATELGVPAHSILANVGARPGTRGIDGQELGDSILYGLGGILAGSLVSLAIRGEDKGRIAAGIGLAAGFLRLVHHSGD